MKFTAYVGKNFLVFLAIGFAFLALLIAISGTSIVLIASDLQGDIGLIGENYAESVRLIGEAQTDANLVRVLVRDLIIQKDPEARNALRPQIDSVIVSISQNLTKTQRIIVEPGEMSSFQGFITAFDRYVDAVREVIDTASAGKSEMANSLLRTKMLPFRRDLDRISKQLVAANLHSARIVRDHVDLLERRFLYSGIFILCLSMITCVTIYYHVAKKFRSYVRGIQEGEQEQERLLKMLQERQEKIERLVVHMTTLEESQRKRFAQELHDGIGHGLTEAKFHADTARSEIGKSTEIAAGHLDKSISTIKETLLETKRISYEMRPTLLDDLGLAAAVKQLVTEFERRSQTKVRAEIGLRKERFDPIVEITVYRIAQEAFVNAEKHSGAKNVFFQMFLRDDGTLVLSISDDGRGFDVGDVAMDDARHLGLRNILERGELIGGTVLIESRPGKGCDINVEIPPSVKESA